MAQFSATVSPFMGIALCRPKLPTSLLTTVKLSIGLNSIILALINKTTDVAGLALSLNLTHTVGLYYGLHNLEVILVNEILAGEK